MQVILTEDEYLNLRSRAIGKQEFNKWRTEISLVQEQVQEAIMIALRSLPIASKTQHIKELGRLLKKLYETSSEFPFETIIKH